MSFEIPHDQGLLDQVIEKIYEVHSYQEQTIKVHEMLVSRTKGLDDKANPNRWWNTTGDWKKNQSARRGARRLRRRAKRS